MKKYEILEVEVEEIDIPDIITTSTGTDTPLVGVGEGGWETI